MNLKKSFALTLASFAFAMAQEAVQPAAPVAEAPAAEQPAAAPAAETAQPAPAEAPAEA